MIHARAVKELVTAAGALALVLAVPARAEDQSTSAGQTMQHGADRADQAASRAGSAAGSAAQDTGNAAQSAGTSAAEATEGAAQKINHKDMKEARKVLAKLHADNQAEIQAGQMAESQAQSDQVKEFAQHLVNDHQKLDKKVTDLAEANNIQLQSKDEKKDLDKATKDLSKLSKKSGADFDKAWVDAQVKDHQQDLKDAKQARQKAQKAKDGAMTALLDQAIPGLQHHLAMAKDLKSSVGQEQGMRQGRRPSGSSMGSSGTGYSTGSSASDTGSSSGSMGSSGSSSSAPATSAPETGAAPGSRGGTGTAPTGAPPEKHNQ